MSSKAKAKALADDFDDDEVASMLGLETPNPSDPEQWVRDNNGDLDWTYTARTIRKWSHDALLTHLYEKSFSIPPREYNPSAPFVWVELTSGDKVTLPHGYRLPLMFVTKYRWEIIHSKISNERLWKQERANVFHLSRLCENLFRRAQAKASRGGMEKGWRCVMFDRLLARFYKHWWRNDPEGGKGFLTTHGPKEYDRDVLKHDWKRWCLRGLNGVKMTEDEVTNGITIDQFRKSLKKNDDGLWTIDGQPLHHITDTEPPDDGSSSELTDYSMESDDNSSDVDDGIDPIIDDTGEHIIDVDDDGNIQGKRPRILTMGDDEMERNNKRSRIQEILPDNVTEGWIQPYRPIYPLSRTLAAMARNPRWAHANQIPNSAIASTSQTPTESTPFSSVPETSPPAISSSMGPPTSVPVHHTLPNGASLQIIDPQAGPSVTVGTDAISAQPSSEVFVTSMQQYPPMSPKPTATPSWPLPPSDDPTRGISAPLPPSRSAMRSGSSFASTSASASFSTSARPSRAASMKSRQKAAAVTAGIGPSSSMTSTPTNANAAASASTSTGGPTSAGLASTSIQRRARLHPHLNPMRKLVKTRVQVPIPHTRTSPAESNSSISSLTSTPRGGTPMPSGNSRNGNAVGMGMAVGTAADVQAHQNALHTKALELLVNLLDVKHVLENNFTAAAAAAATAAASVSNANAQAAHAQQLTSPAMASTTATETETATANPDLGANTSGNANSNSDVIADRKFIDFEGRFAAMKEELKGIVERVQVLEGLTTASTSTGQETEAPVEPRVTVDGVGNNEEAAGMDLGLKASNDVGGLLAAGGDGVAGGNGIEISPEAEKDQGHTKEGSNSVVDDRAEQETSERVGAVKSGETPVDKPTDVNAGVEEENGEKEPQGVEGDKDVVMGDEAGDGGVMQPSPAQESSSEVLAQTKEPIQDEAQPKALEGPAKEDDTPQSAQPENTSPSHLDVQPPTTAVSHTTPSATTTHSPEIELHGLDTHVHAHPQTTSEPDTDITMANTSTASTSSSTLLNEAMTDPRMRDMSSSLTLLVDSLVSAKMLSVMEGIVKTRVKDREDAEKNKAEQEGCISSSSGGDGVEADHEREREVNVNGPSHPLLADSLALNRSLESNSITSLIDEMRAMKSEFRAREQREKEQMQAMRELHSAEVDVLRKRLSYLETQSRQHLDSMNQVSSNTLGGAGDSNGRYHHSSVVASHAESSYQGRHGSPQVGSQSRHAGSHYSNSNINGNGHASARASPGEAESRVKESEPPVRFHTDRNFGFKKAMIEQREDEGPLPIKSQRKHHIILASRTQHGS